jgi:hypothetical protein
MVIHTSPRLTSARITVLLRAAAVAGTLAVAAAAHADVAVTANLDTNTIVAPVNDVGLGLHTSVYGEYNNPNLPSRLRDAGVQLLRYPGGSYADIYQWSTNSSNQGGYVTQSANFPSFVRVMELARAKGMVTVDYGDSQQGTMGGQPKEAAAWVAYANADAGIYGTAGDVALGLDAEGNDWHTAGYWSKLRASTVEEYRTWSQAAGTYNAAYEFLAAGREAPVGIKLWEIGNEIVGGNGYWGYQWEFDLHAPYHNGDVNDNTGRYHNPALSATAYATNLNDFATWMKAVDPTIKIGAGLDSYSSNANHDILTVAGDNIDFGIVHWYPNGGWNYQNVLNAVPQELPQIADTIRSDFQTYAGKGPDDYELHITEFGYGVSYLQPTPPHPIYRALFVADAYATSQEVGIDSMEYLEMCAKDYLDLDPASLPPGEAYYAMQMVNTLCDPGDEFVSVTSSLSTLRIHAVKRADGGLGLMFINEAVSGDGTTPSSALDALVTVDLTGLNLETTGQYYEYGWDNREAGVGPDLQTLTGLTGTIQISIPDLSVVTLLFAPVPALAGDYNGDGTVDAADYTVWRDTLDSTTDLRADGNHNNVIDPDDFEVWKSNFGQSAGSGSTIAAVPEPVSACLLAFGGMLMLLRRRRPVG